jgi:hypothetical protein
MLDRPQRPGNRPLAELAFATTAAAPLVGLRHSLADAIGARLPLSYDSGE